MHGPGWDYDLIAFGKVALLPGHLNSDAPLKYTKLLDLRRVDVLASRPHGLTANRHFDAKAGTTGFAGGLHKPDCLSPYRVFDDVACFGHPTPQSGCQI
jgi:hypothetical protein